MYGDLQKSIRRYGPADEKRVLIIQATSNAAANLRIGTFSPEPLLFSERDLEEASGK